jgi:hypothetical protein
MTMTDVRRGRPATNSGPVISVAVDGPGEWRTAAWCDGYFSGEPDIIESAKLAADLGQEVIVDGAPFAADSTTHFGALAALSSFSPGRTLVIDAPADIWAYLDAPTSCGGRDV